ncbi:MAG: pitrilysin family protein [Rickettsiales bacterium]|jgi:zinc protease
MKKIAFLFTILFTTPAYATDIKEIKTPNGLTAWLVEEHSQPLISVSIAFKNSGTAYDPSNKDGRTAMVTAMLTEGAGDMDSETFSRALETHAVRLSFSADEDNFYATMAMLSEHKDKAFSYLDLALLKPRFDSSAFKRVKRQILSAITQQQEKPNYRLSRAWQEQIFGAHPYNKPELGTLETIENLNQNDLRDFTNRYLARNNMIISVVGDITESELINLLDKNLSNLPEKYNPDVTLADTIIPKDGKQIILKQDIPQTIIHFGMEGLKRSDPDYIVAHIMNYILGGGSLNSRMNSELREKRGLTYSASTYLNPMKHAELFEGGFATRNEKAGEAISVFKQLLKEFSQKGASELELADAKRFLIGSFVVKLDSNASIVNFLTMMQLYHLGIDYIDKRNNLMDAVTVKQINEMAKRLIQLDKLQIIMIGKPQLNGTEKL